MRKRYLLLFLLLLLVPLTAFAVDEINNSLKGLRKKNLVEVIDLSEEKKLSKSDGLGANSSFKSITATPEYLVVSRSNGTLMYLDKTTYSVVHEQKYNLSSNASIMYDSNSNYIIASEGSGNFALISPETYNKGSSIKLEGTHIAYCNKFSRYITLDGKKGNVFDEDKKLENKFTVDTYGTRNDISYSTGYIYLITHNTEDDKIFDTVEKNGNVIYIFDQRGKYKKTYYISNDMKVGSSNNLVSLTVMDGKAYLLYETGEIYSSSVLGNINVDATELTIFKGYKFVNVVRSVFFTLDYYIYSSIVWVIQGLFDIAKLRSYTDIVNNVRNNIYVILGVFMLFRLSITFIRYLINPDDLTDRFKGSKKLIFKTIAMLVLLLMIPSFFELAYRIQFTFIPVVPKLVIGKTEDEAQKDIPKIADDLATVVLSPFFHPNYTTKDKEFASIDGSKDIQSLDDFVKHINDVSPFGRDGDNPGYSYEYRYLLSSIVGMITLVLLVGITLSAAARFFKLLVLEILAPIPVLLNISPYRDENNPFIDWLKETGITFVDLFIKIGLMYIILYFCSEIKDNNMFITWESAEGMGITPLRLLYLKSLLTVGLLLFVYMSPKYINKMFGLDNRNGSFLGSVTSGIVGFGSGLVSGIASGAGVRGSLREGVRGMNERYREAANEQLRNAWGTVDAETQLDANRLKGGVTRSFQDKVNKSKADAESRKGNMGTRNLETSRENFKQATIAAQAAENRYREVIEEGAYEGESTEQYNERRTNAYTEWQVKSKAAEIAEKDYSISQTTYDNSSSAKRYKSHKTSNVKTNEGQGEASKVMMTEVSQQTIGEKRQLEENNTLEEPPIELD